MIIKVFVVLLVCITSKNLQTDNNLTMFPDEQSFFKYSVKANEEEILKEKIKKGLFIDPPPIYEPFSIPNVTKRGLESKGTTIEQSGFFDFDQNGDNRKAYYTYRHIMLNLKQYSSNFLLYPFSFNYIEPETSTSTVYAQGGVFTLRPDILPTSDDTYFFHYISKVTNVFIGKSKAIYDINIAILKIEDELYGNKLDLFYESDTYCSFFTNYLTKASSCLYGKDEFTTFKSSNQNKGAITLFNCDDINNNGLFNNDGTNAIGLIIFPDHVALSENRIIEKFTDKGIQKIKKYIEQGGQILVTGKSGLLLEKMNLLPKGSYDNTKMLLSNTTIAYIKGCENISNEYHENSDYLRRLMCMNNKNKIYTTSTYPMKTYEGYELLLSLDSAYRGMIYKDLNGDFVSIGTHNDFPLLLMKQQGKGKITILNANPLYKSGYTSFFFNLLFASMTKNIIFNNYINFGDNEQLPIPAGEDNVSLQATIEFLNIFDKPVKNFKLYLYAPNDVTIGNYDSSCFLSTQVIQSHKKIESMNLNKHLECSLSSINSFGSFTQKLIVTILSQTVTQQISDISLIYPIIEYIDSESEAKIILDDGAIKVDASSAAVLRATLNPDPSSSYPLMGKGVFADSVLQVENKEKTEALDVDYITVVPLISPVLDGADQSSMIQVCDLYHNYYRERNYTFPWKNDGIDLDYLDFQELSGKNVILIKEWEHPVKIEKVLRGEIFKDPPSTFYQEIDVENLNFTTVIDNPQIVLKQMYFINSDKFYEHATQRLMPFINTATEEGAKAQYGNNIPPDIADPDHPTQTKRKFAWVRNDIYFFNNEEYQLPSGIDESVLISVDNYTAPPIGTSSSYGKEKANIQVKGYFNSSEEIPLKVNEYENLMKKYKFHVQYNPTIETDMQKLKQKTNGEVSFTHYLIEVNDNTITRAGSIMNFTENDDHTGYLTKYPSVQFIFGHKISLSILPSISKQGGELIINLGAIHFKVDNPMEEHLITVSADQIAFYEITYDNTNNLIILKFKRGLLSESSSKASKVIIYLEQINATIDFNITAELYEMKYDLTKKEEGYETYTKISSFAKLYTANFINLYRYPAVLIHNHMNRNIKEYELLAPYTRYGIYIQELLHHTTIYSSVEAHHTTEPGLQAIPGDFITISNIGISAMPFVDYIGHGVTEMIPSAITTSRIEWKDIWGRKWIQPLRSVFPDVPPTPPPLRNFMMSTTFEVLSKSGKERFMTWPSDEEAIVRVQMKFTNSYPKFFVPTICNDNKYPFMKTTPHKEYEQIFAQPTVSKFTTPGDNYH